MGVREGWRYGLLGLPLAFAALPETIQKRYFRGDSACHENGLLDWLKAPDQYNTSTN